MNRLKILVVDDESRMRKLVKDFLVNQNYEVLEAGDGSAALDIFFEHQDIALVILDVMMPKMDGLTVLKKVREHGNAVPVLMLTAKTEIDDRVNGLDSGADDYLGKPFAMKELLARIRAMTRRKTETTHTVLNFGNVSLNRSTFELVSDKGAIRLANKEFQMMEMLMTNPGQIISTERFMEKVWGYDSETEINVVWVYISYLRKKLAGLDADIEIKVTRNQGYSLEVHA